MLIKAIINWLFIGLLLVLLGSGSTRNSSSSAKQGKKKGTGNRKILLQQAFDQIQ
ncbi:MAG: hypothetical protein RIB93_20445 [Coleofasciculus sp. D1-CHI-01]